MSISTGNYTDLKNALKEALIELFQERRDLIHDLFKEVIAEASLAEEKIPTIAS